MKLRLSFIFHPSAFRLHPCVQARGFLSSALTKMIRTSVEGMFEGVRAVGLRRAASAVLLLLVAAVLVASGCRQVKDAAGLSVRPKSLRDVPSERLSFRFEADA